MRLGKNMCLGKISIAQSKNKIFNRRGQKFLIVGHSFLKRSSIAVTKIVNGEVLKNIEDPETDGKYTRQQGIEECILWQ